MNKNTKYIRTIHYSDMFLFAYYTQARNHTEKFKKLRLTKNTAAANDSSTLV